MKTYTMTLLSKKIKPRTMDVPPCRRKPTLKDNALRHSVHPTVRQKI